MRRQGDGVSHIDPQTGAGLEYIFDPASAEVLAQREFLGDSAPHQGLEDIPSGAAISQWVGACM